MSGYDDQQRVAKLVERARLALALGMERLQAAEGACDCFYADGSPRFVTPNKKSVHRCGR